MTKQTSHVKPLTYKQRRTAKEVQPWNDRSHKSRTEYIALDKRGI